MLRHCAAGRRRAPDKSLAQMQRRTSSASTTPSGRGSRPDFIAQIEVSRARRLVGGTRPKTGAEGLFLRARTATAPVRAPLRETGRGPASRSRSVPGRRRVGGSQSRTSRIASALAVVAQSAFEVGVELCWSWASSFCSTLAQYPWIDRARQRGRPPRAREDSANAAVDQRLIVFLGAARHPGDAIRSRSRWEEVIRIGRGRGRRGPRGQEAALRRAVRSGR
jgi:hypothetical protein